MLELETFLETLAMRIKPSPAGPPARAVRRGVALAPDNEGRIAVTAAP